MINWGNEIIRISPKDPRALEYSRERRIWHLRRELAPAIGEFRDLLVYGRELLAATSTGVFYSTSGGRDWHPRCIIPMYGSFLSLNNVGEQLFATTSKGLFYSNNGGRSWVLRQRY